MYITDITLEVEGFECRVAVYGSESKPHIIDRVDFMYCVEDDSLDLNYRLESYLNSNLKEFEDVINEKIN